MISYIRAAWDVAPDVKGYIEAVHRLTNLGALVAWADGFPVELMTGNLSLGHAFGELARQWIFAAAGTLGCSALWRAGSRRYQAYGG